MHQPLALLALLARLLRHAAQPASRHAAAAAAAAADGTWCILLELIQSVEELVAVLVGGLRQSQGGRVAREEGRATMPPGGRI